MKHVNDLAWLLAAGRHCVIGGCGEQLDYWDEGQVAVAR
jgi:hypothetical protein